MGRSRARALWVLAAVVLAVIVGIAVGAADSAVTPQGTAHIGNRAWIDANADGRQDPDEAGLAGVRITVSNLSGTALVSGLTDPDGYWGVSTLETTECYRLAYQVPAGYEASPGKVDGEPTESRIEPDGTVTEQICPTTEPQDEWDAGFVEPTQGAAP